MNFRTRPEAIEAFGEQVTGLAGDIDAAKRYIEQHLSLEWGFGDDTFMYPNAVQASNDVKNAVLASLNQLGAICRSSGDELRKSAQMYATIDEAEAERLDASYPGSQ